MSKSTHEAGAKWMLAERNNEEHWLSEWTAMLKYVLLPLLFIPTHAYAETIVCEFSSYHSPDEPRLQITTDFEMTFRYDLITGEAFMEGNNGISSVLMINGYEGLTFLEVIPTGSVQSTTVQMSGAAVHSRHSMLLGELVPSQYYGLCR
jgi:hypothetical protein